MSIEVKILGRIEATADDVQVALGDRKQRLLFGVLAHELRIVDKGRLIRCLWDGKETPADPEDQIHGYVKGLRAAFRNVTPKGEQLIRTERGVGYELILNPANIDRHRFAQFKKRAEAAERKDPGAAAQLGRCALREWDNPVGVRGGTPLVDSRLEVFTRSLQHDHRSIVLLCLRAELACGRHNHLLSELTRLSTDEYGAEDPDLTRLHMIALFRAGRRDLALSVYQRHAAALDQILGVEPSEGLRILKFEVARGDEKLKLAEQDYASYHEGEIPLTVSGSITSNSFRPLVALPPQLRMLNFEKLVADRTRDFVGRGFVIQAIDDALADSEFRSGYILIRGEPGIGKTSLVSHLVATRKYIHHFNSRLLGVVKPQELIENLCAQLIVRFGLDHVPIPADFAVNEDLGPRGRFLAELLNEAVAKAAGEPIVVLVDALDEATDHLVSPGQNKLGLAPSLPDGVFLICTSREQVAFRLEGPRRDIYLHDKDPLNLKDVRAFTRAFLKRHAPLMVIPLRDWCVSDDEFVDVLTSHSEGNFMYLVHVLEDIRAGLLARDTIGRLDNLPHGLTEYYDRHWQLMRSQDAERFERIYEPVLRVLATVREPIALDYLQELTSLPNERVREVFRAWRPFLNEHPAPLGLTRYRIYHTSFQEFLRNEGPGLGPTEDQIINHALGEIFPPDELSDEPM